MLVLLWAIMNTGPSFHLLPITTLTPSHLIVHDTMDRMHQSIGDGSFVGTHCSWIVCPLFILVFGLVLIILVILIILIILVVLIILIILVSLVFHPCISIFTH